MDDPRGSPWKSSFRDSVSNRAFSKFKDVFVSFLSPSLTLTPSHSHTNRPTLTLKTCRWPTLTVLASPTPTVTHPLTLSAPTVAHPLTLSLTNPVPRLCQSPFPPSHRYPRQKNRDVWNGHHRALKSFSLHGLWKKKKRWVPLCKMQSVFHCVYAKKQWEKSKNLLWKFFFFFFWFLFWISNRTVKKDWSFIVFWVRIVFLGLFIFWVCLGFRVLSFGFRWLFRC